LVSPSKVGWFQAVELPKYVHCAPHLPLREYEIVIQPSKKFMSAGNKAKDETFFFIVIVRHTSIYDIEFHFKTVAIFKNFLVFLCILFKNLLFLKNSLTAVRAFQK